MQYNCVILKPYLNVLSICVPKNSYYTCIINKIIDTHSQLIL